MKDNGPHALPASDSCLGKHPISSYQSSMSKLQSLKYGFVFYFKEKENNKKVNK